MITIAVDFDGTLVRSTEYDVEAVPGAREALQNLRAKGYRIVIHTCRTTEAIERGNLMEEVDYIKRVLENFQMEYDEIYIGEKFIANIYIDDRAVGFNGNWEETEAKASAMIDLLVKQSA